MNMMMTILNMYSTNEVQTLLKLGVSQSDMCRVWHRRVCVVFGVCVRSRAS